MATIKNINFEHVGRNAGCLCDRCGQYIQNIATVTYNDGLELHYGLDCFSKLTASGNLTAHGARLFRKTVNNIKSLQKMLSDYKSGKITAENDSGWYWLTTPNPDGVINCAYSSYDEYREFVINEILPARIEKAQNELKKFSKVSFEPYE